MAAPLTPFEQRGRIAPWTSRAEEDAWITGLLAAGSRWSMTVAGTSVEGSPMRLFWTGTGPKVILHVAQQHGSELSGREAWLTTMRQWADSTDPALLDYLTKVTVLVMPTCHPDNFTTRENVNGVNLNRDHVKLSQPETRAIHTVIRDHQPDVIVDWHEGANIAANYATSPSFNANEDPQITALSGELSDRVKTDITAAGHTWELYQGPAAMTRGPEYLANAAAIAGRVGLLLETARVYGNDTDVAARHDRHLIAVNAIWQWHAANLDRVSTAVTGAKARVAARTSPLTLQTGTSSSGPVVDPLPTGYLLDATQRDATAVQRDLFSLTGEQRADGYFVGTAQPGQVVVVYLLDPSSGEKVVAGSPIGVPPTVHLPLGPGTVIGYKFRLNGITYDAELHAKPSN